MIRISFIYPQYLLFLLLIPFLIFIHFISLTASKGKALRFANLDAIQKIRGIDIFSKNLTVLMVSSIIVFLLSFAAAGTIIYMYADATSHSFAITLDASDSMRAEDVYPNRLEAAKEAAKDFVDSTPRGTSIGLVSFSGISFIEQDLTESKELIKDSIDQIEIFRVGGSDIHEAIITSTNILKGEEAKAIVLFSDGQMNVGILEGIISYARDNDVIVHTIGVGTEEGGMVGYGISRLNDETLKAISYNTNGVYVKLADIESDDVFDEIIRKTRKNVPVNISIYLIIISLIFFVILFILVNLRYRGLP